MIDYFLLFPVIMIIALSFFVILAGLFIKQKKALGYVTISGLLAAFLVTLSDFNADASLFYNSIVIDPFVQFFNLLFLMVSLLVCIASLEYYGNNPNQDEYYSLLLLATAGMMFVSLSNDLIILFVGFELVSLPTYILAGFDKKNPRSMEASLKYFIIGALSSAILLFGISFIYGVIGATNLEVILSHSVALVRSPIALLGMIFIFVGFGFKMALVPFHMWAPDTYEGAPPVVSAFLSAGSKTVGFVAAFRVFLIALIAIKLGWYIAFAILAVITMSVGNVIAIAQRSVKRMLAYSSIAHAGYVIIAFVVIAHSTDVAQYALAGGILHALSHAIGKAGAFIVTAFVGYMIMRNGGGNSGADTIEDYDGLGKRAPITALLMTILLFSLAGIPPTFGFYTKFILFLSAVQGGLLWLAIIAVLNSALSVYYYAKVVMRIYWSEPKGEKIIEPRGYVLAVLLAVVAIIILGVYPEPLYKLAMDAAEVLVGGF
jgi:NADH-quinone oxidoreductase subunit N